MAIGGTWVSVATLKGVASLTDMGMAVDDSGQNSLEAAEEIVNTIINAVESGFKAIANGRYSADITAGTASASVSYNLSVMVVRQMMARRGRMTDVALLYQDSLQWLEDVRTGKRQIAEWTSSNVVTVGKKKYSPIKDLYDGSEQELETYEGAQGEHFYDERS